MKAFLSGLSLGLAGGAVLYALYGDKVKAKLKALFS
jgi:hypothetical protein